MIDVFFLFSIASGNDYEICQNVDDVWDADENDDEETDRKAV